VLENNPRIITPKIAAEMVDISTIHHVDLGDMNYIFDFFQTFEDVLGSEGMDGIQFALTFMDIRYQENFRKFVFYLQVGGCPQEVIDRLYFILTGEFQHQISHVQNNIYQEMVVDI